MKSNDWRHKNVARYTPGNTKILYFFNCLLDGMHTTFNLQRLKSQICFIYLPESVNFACGNPLFIVSSTLEPTAYPTHDGQYAAAYETYEKEVSPDTPHKSLTLPDSHVRNDVRSGNQGSRGS